MSHAEEAQKIADVQITEMQCSECGEQFFPVSDQEWFDQSRAEYVEGALQGSPVYTYRNFMNQVPCNACAQMAFAAMEEEDEEDDDGEELDDDEDEDEEPPF